jgi:hypothetical protein
MIERFRLMAIELNDLKYLIDLMKDEKFLKLIKEIEK